MLYLLRLRQLTDRVRGRLEERLVESDRIARELHPVVREETQQIGAEALRNAFHHADAHRVELEITFDRTELKLRIRDDGKAIDPATLAAGARPGHWGLVGMAGAGGQDPRTHGYLESRGCGH